MRRLFIVVLALLLSAMISVPITVHGQDLPGFSYSWIGAAYRGYDPFYDATVYAYEENTKAILSITISANSTHQLNVSSVRITFDWADGIYNGSYADEVISPENILIIPEGEKRIVGIEIDIPSTSVVSNLYLHSYTILVEHLNATSPPTETQSITETKYDFAVYSADQADARDLYARVQTVRGPTVNFTSSRAKMLVYKAQNETSTGNMTYTHGDFAGAETHYEAALTLYNSAYVAEETFSVTDEDLSVNATKVEIQLDEARIKQVESWASMVFSVGTTLTLFGVTTILFGIGYILKQLAALKKAGQQTATTTTTTT